MQLSDSLKNQRNINSKEDIKKYKKVNNKSEIPNIQKVGITPFNQNKLKTYNKNYLKTKNEVQDDYLSKSIQKSNLEMFNWQKNENNSNLRDKQSEKNQLIKNSYLTDPNMTLMQKQQDQEFSIQNQVKQDDNFQQTGNFNFNQVNSDQQIKNSIQKDLNTKIEQKFEENQQSKIIQGNKKPEQSENLSINNKKINKNRKLQSRVSISSESRSHYQNSSTYGQHLQQIPIGKKSFSNGNAQSNYSIQNQKYYKNNQEKNKFEFKQLYPKNKSCNFYQQDIIKSENSYIDNRKNNGLNLNFPKLFSNNFANDRQIVNQKDVIFQSLISQRGKNNQDNNLLKKQVQQGNQYYQNQKNQYQNNNLGLIDRIKQQVMQKNQNDSDQINEFMQNYEQQNKQEEGLLGQNSSQRFDNQGQVKTQFIQKNKQQNQFNIQQINNNNDEDNQHNINDSDNKCLNKNMTLPKINQELREKIKFNFKDRSTLKALSILKISKEDSIPIKIIDHIYIGSIGAALSQNELKKNNIEYILNATADEQIPDYNKIVQNCQQIQKIQDVQNEEKFDSNYQEKVKQIKKYKQIKLKDNYQQQVLDQIKESNSYIQEAENEQKNILVHCFQGKSRSCTLIIAYMMQRYKMKRDEALDIIRKYRPNASPNFGFMKQLLVYEKQLLQSEQIKCENFQQKQNNQEQLQ
ncbi:hypothetical protein PPERSA_09066 [Pseudocohnilembus persalinus]|uniref:protein-tyrosine-phosphatase n=1 Tax=Pseudocohnilembus persalinus TaxID=266149 RepID=A0A0V0QLS7_PSEPJ|nr:hypothetical protein PPERSA_09066 [Pseudocohnilembus persalinus]|eukprot:KRX02944.1 hypothetical protein PPERSA_09066 [Pseudocohnilembus persalinus]